MKTLEMLIQARELIVQKEWAKGCYARDFNGREIDEESPLEEIGSFCTLGALERARCNAFLETGTWSTANLSWSRAQRQLEIAISGDSARHDFDVALWNDEVCQSKEEVLAAYDKAIAAEKLTDQEFVPEEPVVPQW